MLRTSKLIFLYSEVGCRILPFCFVFSFDFTKLQLPCLTNEYHPVLLLIKFGALLIYLILLQLYHLQLEEFRKKRAAEKAKKTTSNTQQLASDGGVDNRHSGNEHTKTKDSSGAATSDAVGRSVLEPSEIHAKHDFAKPDLTQKSDLIFPSDSRTGATPSLHEYYDDAVVIANSYDSGSSISALSHLENKGSRSDENLKVSQTASDTYDNNGKRESDGALESVPFGFATNHSTATFPPFLNHDRTSSHFTYDDMGKHISEESHAKDLSVTNDGTSRAFPANVSPSNPFGSRDDKPRYTDPWASDMTSASYGDKFFVNICSVHLSCAFEGSSYA